MKTLPSYEEIYEWFRDVKGVAEPLPPPETRPTRKGIGRYLAANYERDTFIRGLSEWRRLWWSCSLAQQAALREFHIRLPRDTFAFERNKTWWTLRLLADARFMEQPGVPPRDPDEVLAYRWATR